MRASRRSSPASYLHDLERLVKVYRFSDVSMTWTGERTTHEKSLTLPQVSAALPLGTLLVFVVLSAIKAQAGAFASMFLTGIGSFVAATISAQMGRVRAVNSAVKLRLHDARCGARESPRMP